MTDGIMKMEERPYERLYIYLLNGVVREEDEGTLGESFVGNWVEADSSFLFFRGPAWSLVDRLLKRRPYLEFSDDFLFNYEDWQGGIASPIEIDDFVILPPWAEKDYAGKGAMQIRLDPGVVFGNGLHPTTRDCLRALPLAAGRSPIEQVLDLGTGTGILALASSLLGAESVLAIDLNPLCVKTAARNIALNGLQEIIKAVNASADQFSNEPADLIIANLHQDVIRPLLDKRNFKKGDRVILSGLLRTPFREVGAQLERSDFKIIGEWDYEMTWFTLLAEKR